MYAPDDLDGLLTQLLQRTPAVRQPIDHYDREFIDGIIKAVETGSRAVFIVLHPNDDLQYILLNENLDGALKLLDAVRDRTRQARNNGMY